MPYLAKPFRRFWADQSGNLTLYGLFAAFIMAAFGGIGIDLMATEMKRAKIQAVLDQATLAAADMDNTVDPELVVRDYFDKMNISEALASVDIDTSGAGKIVTAEADVVTAANFTRLLDIGGFSSRTLSQAQESGNPTEISLVIDISLSMSWNNRIQKTREAAKQFADIVLSPENEGMVSVSLVPYSAAVNVGPEIASQLRLNRIHNHGECFEFPDAEYRTTVLDRTRLYDQVQNFTWNYWNVNQTWYPMCPRENSDRVSAFRGTAAALKTDIGRLRARNYTALYQGLKWGGAMLDPSFRPITNHLVAENQVSDAFLNRPAAYNDGTAKHVVLMTDGKNSDVMKMPHWAVDTFEETNYWRNTNLWHHLRYNVPKEKWSNWYYKQYTDTDGDRFTLQMCDAIKARGVIVWTIGFELDDHGADILRRCATSESHYFRVAGNEIFDTFNTIARDIVQLRLTQ